MPILFKLFFLLGITLLVPGPVASADSPAQVFDKLPSCVKICVITAYQSLNNACAQLDTACFCKSPVFINTSASCYANTCTGDDLEKAHSWGLSSCAQAGVPLHVTNSTTNSTATVQPAQGTNSSSASAQAAKSSAGVLVFSAGLIIACSLLATIIHM
ncbi:hypothetical protein PCANC_12649 [Puccinia coronata f. sp. avenae]|uniref:CFEM domain-containing protein n=1 Tax=Puccinia coronata f. sp. avenae TaxID=200324 RepID=A0A2N5T2S3_9BASI|nr:hypothetical protein PCANC_12649 [Puccinia coronata f. sp. avenae]